MERPILVIDDSDSISIRLKEFLEKLGYNKIYIVKEADNGIKKFQELGKNGNHPTLINFFSDFYKR